MFLNYNNVRNFLIEESKENFSIDDYLQSLSDNKLLPIILNNISVEIGFLATNIIYNVLFNNQIIGTIERDKYIKNINNEVKLCILKEVLMNDDSIKDNLTNLIMNYNISKLNSGDVDLKKIFIYSKLLKIFNKKEDMTCDNSLKRNFCEVLYSVYYDNMLIGDYIEKAYQYSTSDSNDFNACKQQVDKEIIINCRSEITTLMCNLLNSNNKYKKNLNIKNKQKAKGKYSNRNIIS